MTYPKPWNGSVPSLCSHDFVYPDTFLVESTCGTLVFCDGSTGNPISDPSMNMTAFSLFQRPSFEA